MIQLIQVYKFGATICYPLLISILQLNYWTWLTQSATQTPVSARPVLDHTDALRPLPIPHAGPVLITISYTIKLKAGRRFLSISNIQQGISKEEGKKREFSLLPGWLCRTDHRPFRRMCKCPKICKLDIPCWILDIPSWIFLIITLAPALVDFRGHKSFTNENTERTFLITISYTIKLISLQLLKVRSCFFVFL